MLAPAIKDQIEDTIGRPLQTEELIEVPSLEQLTEAHLSVGRILARRQIVACVKYLRAIVADLDTHAAGEYMESVLKDGGSIDSWRGRHLVQD
jgi:hypothetical protein